jgi:tetratricopeptide (TPR) repeat protein
MICKDLNRLKCSFILRSMVIGALGALVLTSGLAQSQVYERILSDYQRKDYSSAVSLAARAVEAEGNNPSLRYIYGLALAELQRFPEASDNLRKAIELRPGDSNFHQGMAYLLCKQKKYDDAIPVLKRAIELDGENLKARFLLGLAYLSKERSSLIGNFTELALEQLQFVEAKQPTFPQVHLYIGKIHLTNGDVAGALQEFRTELQLDPRNVQAHMETGELLTKLDRSDEALVHLREVAASSSMTTGLDYALAKAYRQSGKLNEAIASAKRAVENNARSADAHYLLAQLYQDANKPDLAREHMEAFEKLRVSKQVPGPNEP